MILEYILYDMGYRSIGLYNAYNLSNSGDSTQSKHPICWYTSKQVNPTPFHVRKFTFGSKEANQEIQEKHTTCDIVRVNNEFVNFLGQINERINNKNTQNIK